MKLIAEYKINLTNLLSSTKSTTNYTVLCCFRYTSLGSQDESIGDGGGDTSTTQLY